LNLIAFPKGNNFHINCNVCTNNFNISHNNYLIILIISKNVFKQLILH
jgi:hypothetical protein